MKAIFILILLMLNNSYGTSFYLSSTNLKQVDDKYVDTQKHNESFYRVDGGKRFYFYSIKLNDIYYETKTFFSLSTIKDIEPNKILKTRFFYDKGKTPIVELIINHDFLLVDSSISKIYYKNNNRFIQLNSSKHTSLIEFESKFKATINIFENGKLQEIGEVPYIFSIKNSNRLIFLFNNSELLPYEYIVYKSKKSLQNVFIKTTQIPELKFISVSGSINLNDYSDDKKIVAIDSLLNEIENIKYKNDKLLSSFKKIISNNLFKLDKKRSFETMQDYLKYKDFHEALLEKIILNAVKKSNYVAVNSILKERKNFLINTKKEIINRNSKRSTTLNRYLFLGISFFPGRNLPNLATTPGPSKLLGGGAQLEYFHYINTVLDGVVKLDVNYSRWFYNKLYNEYSTDRSLILSYGISLPFQAPLTKLTRIHYVNIYLFGSVGYQLLSIKENVNSNYKKYFGGGGFGIDLRLTSLPIMLGFDYGYYSNEFGDLKIYFKIPLRRAK